MATELRFQPQVSLKTFPLSDGLVLPIQTLDRPLRGVAGLADWRLHGMLSRLLADGLFHGDFGESCLVPGGGWLPVDKVLLFGVGVPADRDPDRLAWAAAEIASTLAGLGASRQVWPLIELAGPRIPGGLAMEILLDVLEDHGALAEVCVAGGGASAGAMRERATQLLAEDGRAGRFVLR